MTTLIANYIVLCFFSVMAHRADSFFFSSSSSTERDCAWLPWQYTGCIKSGSGYQKVENRGKIALHGGATCDSETESRTVQSCTVSEFIASTILSTITNRRTEEHNSASYFSQGNEWEAVEAAHGFVLVCGPTTDCAAPVPGETSTTTETPPTTARPRNICGDNFIDSISGVKMLGANCRSRKRRSAKTSGSVKSRTKRQFGGSYTSIEHRDILFLLDESGSVGRANFEKQLEFVEVISEKFSYPRQVSRSATRVAVTTFASDQKHHIDLINSANLGEFKSELRKVKYRGGRTCLVDSLRAARTEVFTTRGGSRVPSGAADGLIILVTDGCSNCHGGRGGELRHALQEEQIGLENIGVTILTFSVNVGGSCENTLRALQDGSSCFRGFSYPSWEKFDELIQDFRNMQGVIDRWTQESATCP